jgi:II/X family phage/plasmid replication protein
MKKEYTPNPQSFVTFAEHRQDLTEAANDATGSHVFIDWLTIYQDFPELDLPYLGETMKVETCLLTGEIKSEQVKAYKHKGSFDTTLLITWHKRRLYMSGNPSAFARPDNLFGLESVWRCVEVYNEILRGLGYPEFSDYDGAELRAMPYQSKDQYFQPGAKITRIDLTTNFFTTPPHERKAISQGVAISTDWAQRTLRFLSSLSYRGQAGHLYPNGMTVDWFGDKGGKLSKGGSDRLYLKYYAKAWDFAIKLKKLERRQKKQQCPYLQETIDYLTQLRDYCQQNGVVRHELSLKSKLLTELGLQSISGWSDMSKVIELSERYQLHRKQSVEVQAPDEAFKKLLELGYPRRKARTLAELYQVWLCGKDLHYERNPQYTKSAYYRNRRDLMQLGIDIAQPCNITTLPVKFDKIALVPASMPSYYRQAS